MDITGKDNVPTCVASVRVFGRGGNEIELSRMSSVRTWALSPEKGDRCESFGAGLAIELGATQGRSASV